MSMRTRTAVLLLAGVWAVSPRPASLAAQAVQAGMVGGAIALPDSLDQVGLGAILQLQPVSWLTLGAHPAWVHVTGAGSGSSGLADLPLEAGIWHELPGPLSPGAGLSLGLTLPTGDTARGLGSGETSVGGSLGVSVSPVDHWSLGVDVYRPLSGTGWSTALSGAQATSLSLEASWEPSDRTSIHGGFAADLGSSDSTGAVRSLTGGLTLPVKGPISLAVDGTRGLTSAAPAWGLSVGIGSAFAGINPVGPGSPLRRLGAAFAHGVNRGRGLGHVGGTTGVGRGRGQG